MPVTTTYPGVYVQEVPSGVRTISGVSTSIAMFIGRAKKGPMKQPVLCLNFSDFERAFSSEYASSDLARAVRLFFQNGGTQCYVMRIANNARAAQVVMKNEAGAGSSVLIAESKSAGKIGNDIRMAVTYNTQYPEATFNLEVFRWEKRGDKMVKADAELFTALTMEPDTPRYAPDYVTQNSNLIKLTDVNAGVPSTDAGYSVSGRPLPAKTPADFLAAVPALMGRTSTNGSNCFRLSADSGPYDIDLKGLDFANNALLSDPVKVMAELPKAIKDIIYNQCGLDVIVELYSPGPTGAGTFSQTVLLKLSSLKGDVRIEPAAEGDLAVPLMLGTSQGGLEVSRYASRRPAPTGVVLKGQADLIKFAGLQQQSVTDVKIDGTPITLPASNLVTTAGTDPMCIDNSGGFAGIREKWNILATAVSAVKGSDPSFPWSAEIWGSRLALISDAGGHNSQGTLTSGQTDFNSTLSGMFRTNVRYYSLGITTATGYQAAVANGVGDEGACPKPSDYDDAYKVIDREVDLFNLLVLPQDAEHGAKDIASLWGPASVFCQKRRAFLIMDAPSVAGSEWKTVQDAVHLSKGVNSLRVGLVKDFSALFYPRMVVDEDGKQVKVGASGAIAGLMARIDGTRGVWKAPAGTEADLRGIVGLEYKLSDGESGVLNPKAVNTLRVFPNGIVNWGARTMDGDDDFGSEYKYIPIRRLALYMEESLYRGLKWVVFEPNDEPLWSQIRLNVGAFMHDLFRQGAFQGQTPKDAYFVKCDRETTTQNDRDLGRVNIWVGFAPLKPAEFVIIYLQQIAGQIQV